MDDLLWAYGKPLVLTILFELIGAYLMGLRRKDLLLNILVNVLTNPVLVTVSILLMYHKGIETGRLLTYLIAEPLVIISEYLLYKDRLEWKGSPLLLSVTLNILSICGGVLCQKLF